MVVLLVAVAAFVAFRGLTRDQPEVRPEATDYLSSVRLLQSADRTVVYPDALPSGWIATRADAGAAGDESWSLNLLTDGDLFVGVRQEDAELETLVDTYVDPDAVEGETIGVENALAPRWRQFTDDGGDTAYAAEVDGDWVLVYGSASTADLLRVVESLTDADL